METTAQAWEIGGPAVECQGEVLTEPAIEFLVKLDSHFELRRQALLAFRRVRQGEIDAGRLPGFLAETAKIRRHNWKVAAIPKDLQDRRVEITGPVDRK